MRTGQAGDLELDDATVQADRRSDILRAAARVFARKGFHGCRMADVAEEAGVAYGLVYHYFRSKELLLKAVFTGTFGAYTSRLAQIAAGEGGAAMKLESMVAAAIETLRTDPDVVRLVVIQVNRTPAILDPEVLEYFLIVTETVADVLRAAQRTGELRAGVDPELAAQWLLGALEGMFSRHFLAEMTGQPLNLEASGRSLTDVFFHGVFARNP